MSKSPLTIGYSVLAERAKNISLINFKNPPVIFLSVQNPYKIKYTLPELGDFDLIERDVVGVAKSRNEVLRNATTKYLIFADDDITFHEEDLYSAIEYLEQHLDCDMVLGSTVDEDNKLRKKYSTTEVALTRFNSAKAATYEMLIRVDSFRSKNLSFDENFGAGVTNYLGDEYILIADLLQRSGKGVFLPLIFASHPSTSSGSGWAKPKDLKARAAVFDRIFGIWAIPIRFAFIARPGRQKISPVQKLRFILNKW